METGLAADLRAGYDAFNRADWDAWFDWLHPDIEMRESFLGPDQQIYRGRDGVRQWLASAGEGLRDVRFVLHDVFELGPETVVVDVEAVGRGTASGVEVRARLAHLIRLRDGKVALLAAYPSVHHAQMAAAGRDG